MLPWISWLYCPHPMISDLDIYRAANLLIDRYGDNALTEASQMIDRMLAEGDIEGRIVWRRIKRAIEALQTAPSGPVH
jgi:hypothetical protein